MHHLSKFLLGILFVCALFAGFDRGFFDNVFVSRGKIGTAPENRFHQLFLKFDHRDDVGILRGFSGKRPKPRWLLDRMTTSLC